VKTIHGKTIKNSKGESEFQNNVEDINVEVYLFKKMENETKTKHGRNEQKKNLNLKIELKIDKLYIVKNDTTKNKVLYRLGYLKRNRHIL
jgi:hypothetical protein